MLLINEIFHSIQGEGPWSGHPSIFIRFSGCNLSCSFCDTEHESILHSMDEMDLARYLLSSFPNSTKLVVITGGEPFLQNIGPLVRILSDNYKVQIETNGTLYQPQFPYHLASIVCSPKPQSQVHPQLIPFISAWKFLIADGMQLGNHLPFHQINNELVYLQPIDTGDFEQNKKNIDAAVAMCIKYNYKLSLQIHKIVGIR